MIGSNWILGSFLGATVLGVAALAQDAASSCSKSRSTCTPAAVPSVAAVPAPRPARALAPMTAALGAHGGVHGHVHATTVHGASTPHPTGMGGVVVAGCDTRDCSASRVRTVRPGFTYRVAPRVHGQTPAAPSVTAWSSPVVVATPAALATTASLAWQDMAPSPEAAARQDYRRVQSEVRAAQRQAQVGQRRAQQELERALRGLQGGDASRSLEERIAEIERRLGIEGDEAVECTEAEEAEEAVELEEELAEEMAELAEEQAEEIAELAEEQAERASELREELAEHLAELQEEMEDGDWDEDAQAQWQAEFAEAFGEEGVAIDLSELGDLGQRISESTLARLAETLPEMQNEIQERIQEALQVAREAHGQQNWRAAQEHAYTQLRSAHGAQRRAHEAQRESMHENALAELARADRWSEPQVRMRSSGHGDNGEAMQEIAGIIREMSDEVRGLRDEVRSLRDEMRRQR